MVDARDGAGRASSRKRKRSKHSGNSVVPAFARESTADLEPEERRGWLSHGIAALAISALGLAVAGSVSLTTSAQTTAETPADHSHQRRETSGRPSPDRPPRSAHWADRRRARARGLHPSGRPKPTKSPGLRTEAIVEERAAQRSEDLTESAEEISRAALEQGKSARLQELAKADRARREAAVKIARSGPGRRSRLG